jgi:IMP dehydrogenase
VLKPSLLLSFDDVWLEPQISFIESRTTPDLSSYISAYHKLKHPVIATNMASVVGEKMAKTFDESGSIAFHHRFLTREQICLLAENFQQKPGNIFGFSVGIKDEDLDTAKEVYQMLGDNSVILVDVAHAHTTRMGTMVENVKKIGYKTVVAGNVATGDAFNFLGDYGADSVRVGIAGGKVCTTKFVTGHHIPTLQSVIECYDARLKSVKNCNVSIIADGGISNSGDAVKAIAAGADFVCLGSLLASTSDSPGEYVTQPDGHAYKMHYGMSSDHALKLFFNNKKNHVAAEGKTDWLPYSGQTTEVLNEFLAGIKSGLSYSGAKNIEDFQLKAVLRYKKL